MFIVFLLTHLECRARGETEGSSVLGDDVGSVVEAIDELSRWLHQHREGSRLHKKTSEEKCLRVGWRLPWSPVAKVLERASWYNTRWRTAARSS
jgi:hypothetical protein